MSLCIPIVILLSLVISTILILFVFSTLKNRKEGFHFEVTPEKLCDGGPYMTQTGPNHEYCLKMWNSPEGRAKLGNYNCLHGDCKSRGLTNGRPVNMAAMTPLSNANWENEMCSKPVLGKNRPRVL